MNSERTTHSEQAAYSVSFVIPILNEARHVRAAVESVLAQEGLAEHEVILVVGKSKDNTDAIVAELAAHHDNVVVVSNPDNAISRAMNLGISAARFGIVIRVDAHSLLQPDYAAKAAASLRETGAANLGGRMRAQGTTPFENAVAWAYNSRVGLGGAIYHVGEVAGPAESAYLGVFDRKALSEIGGFDETLSRGEDWELNFRFRESGQLVWFAPDLEVVYRPRSTFRALAKQFYASGRWRAELIRRLGQRIPLRYFLPPVLVATLLASGLAILVSLFFTFAAGPAALIGILAGLAIPVVYLAALAIVAAFAPGLDAATRVRLPLVLASMHVCWGWGCLLGLVLRNRGNNSFAGR